MDSHLKERIVGAAVLVALGVWLIPWVLDGPEPEPVATATPELQLPSPDAATPVRTETVELSSRPAGPREERGGLVLQEAAGEEPPLEVRTSLAPIAAPAAETAAVAALPVPPAAWSVQVGAFGDRANANQLARRVADYGYRAQVSEFRSDGQAMYRVRVEGFATRAQAEAAGSSLSAHGVPARVVPAD